MNDELRKLIELVVEKHDTYINTDEMKDLKNNTREMIGLSVSINHLRDYVNKAS